MTTTTIDPERVNAIFLDCLIREGEDTTKHVKAEGTTKDVEFHSERLETHKAEIEAMLNELPDEFKRSKGGGMSFLSACVDKHGNQWTGFHERMQQLFQLGLGVGKVKFMAPREMWKTFYGGMPYYIVD